MEYKSNKIIMVIILAASVLLIGGGTITGTAAHAGKPEQNWSVGFTDGCDDAKAGDSTAYYSHSNSPHHSDDYNAGYNAGIAQCKPGAHNDIVSSPTNDVTTTTATDNSNQNNRNQNQGQSLTNPHSNCFVLIGGCTNQNLQGESLNN